MMRAKRRRQRTSEMNLFRLHAEIEQGATCGHRTWLVIAGSLFEAMSFVPEEFSVKAIEVQVGAARGPLRVVASSGAPIIH